jgi:hypothetical protein
MQSKSTSPRGGRTKKMGLPVIEVRDIPSFMLRMLEASRDATGCRRHHIVCVWCSLFGDDVACIVMKPVHQ